MPSSPSQVGVEDAPGARASTSAPAHTPAWLPSLPPFLAGCRCLRTYLPPLPSPLLPHACGAGRWVAGAGAGCEWRAQVSDQQAQLCASPGSVMAWFAMLPCKALGPPGLVPPMPSACSAHVWLEGPCMAGRCSACCRLTAPTGGTGPQASLSTPAPPRLLVLRQGSQNCA